MVFGPCTGLNVNLQKNSILGVLSPPCVSRLMERADHNRMVPAEGADKYTDSIELSNACREFYQSRLKSAQTLKEKWGSDRKVVNISDSNGNEKKKSSIDIAMEKLRSEMVRFLKIFRFLNFFK